jgi:hypothetical protein
MRGTARGNEDNRQLSAVETPPALPVLRVVQNHSGGSISNRSLATEQALSKRLVSFRQLVVYHSHDAGNHGSAIAFDQQNRVVVTRLDDIVSAAFFKRLKTPDRHDSF